MAHQELQLSRLGNGCWSYGGGDYWGDRDQSETNKIVDVSLDRGITYFDTAEGYYDGGSETSLGIALKHRRDEALIGTKVSPSHARPSDLRRSCEASLRRLQTDYIDYYMMHWPINDPEISVEEAFREMENLKKEGKIRHIGISNFGVTQMEELIGLGIDVSVNQLAYNVISRAIEFDIIPYCKKHNISIVGYMPLMQGLLSGKYNDLEDLPLIRKRTRHFNSKAPESLARHGEEGCEEELKLALNELQRFSDNKGITMSTLALAWSMNKIECTIVGSSSLEQLNQNIAASEVKLSVDELEAIDRITDPIKAILGANADLWQTGERVRVR